ncbi:MAG: alpha/beta hydrolase domain-containing protein [Burkholderiaceae bacterium]
MFPVLPSRGFVPALASRLRTVGVASIVLLALAGCAGPGGNAASPRPAGSIQSFEVKSRAEAFGGERFGRHGAYERIVAVVTGRLDPTHPANAGIVDLARAPRDADGMVEYRTDAMILRPKDASKARRVLFYDVANRGRPLAHMIYFNEGGGFAKPADAGNAFLMREGFTVVWSGWQGDLPMSGNGKAMGAAFPTAHGADGSPITGTVRDEFVFDKKGSVRVARLSYAVADSNPARAILRVKRYQSDAWKTLDGWRYDGERTVRFTHPAGYDAGAIFEFIYPARDPVVMGIGFAAVRDLVSFLRHAEKDGAGQPNPLADLRNAPCEIRGPSGECPSAPSSTVDVAILEGISQSGRMVRDFLWQGFNRDGLGRRVFDGAMPLIAGSRKTWTNFRFAQPGRWSKQHEEHFQAGDQFPFTYAPSTDPVSGRTDGIFASCAASNTCPKLMHVDGGAEFWQARASLIGTDGSGKDVELPANARAYLLTGTPHAYSRNGKSAKPATCALPSNIVNPASTVRALTVALLDWIARGVAPPASRWPSVAAGTLADPSDRAAVRLPDLGALGVRYGGVHNFLHLTDYGRVPPAVDLGKPYRVLVPVTDADGNDVGGVRTPDVSVPLGTHLSWNPRDTGFAPGQACGGQGAFIPFAAEKPAAGDPRASVRARYVDRAAYVARVTAAAKALQAERLMLDGDVARWTARAQRIREW